MQVSTKVKNIMKSLLELNTSELVQLAELVKTVGIALDEDPSLANSPDEVRAKNLFDAIQVSIDENQC